MNEEYIEKNKRLLFENALKVETQSSLITLLQMIGLIASLITSAQLLHTVGFNFNFLTDNFFVNIWNGASPDAQLQCLTTIFLSFPVIGIIRLLLGKKK